MMTQELMVGIKEEIMKKIDKQKIARELLRIAKDIEALKDIDDGLTLKQQVQLVKDYAAVKKFFKELVKFKGSLNDFINNISSMTSNPKSLKHFPEVLDVALLAKFFKDHNLMKLIRMDDDTIKEKISEIYKEN